MAWDPTNPSSYWKAVEDLENRADQMHRALMDGADREKEIAARIFADFEQVQRQLDLAGKINVSVSGNTVSDDLVRDIESGLMTSRSEVTRVGDMTSYSYSQEV